MYGGTKGKDPLHSGTGVFYQAIPAVGADGRNIMKLIPVQMVNGHVFKSQISPLKTDATQPKALSWNIASAPVVLVKKTSSVSSATERIVSEQVSLVGSSPYEVGLDPGNSPNKHPRQQLQQSVKTLAVVPSKASPAHSGNSVGPPSQLPVPVHSPAAPRSRGTEVLPTVPASTLPAGIWKQTFTSSASCCPGSHLPSSPTTSTDGGVTPQRDSALNALKLLCKITNTTSCAPPSKGSKSHFNLIPKVPQSPNSPKKWSVEDNSPTAPTLNPFYSSVTSKILRVLAERGNAGKPCEILPKPGPTLDSTNPSFASEILREREKARKDSEVITKSITESGPGNSGEEKANVIDPCNRKQPPQQSVHLMAVTPLANGGNTGPLNDLHVALTAPTPPRGQWPLSTPKAQLWALPASERRAAIKKPTFTPSATSCPSSACAVSMPLIASVNQGAPRDSALDTSKWLCKTANKTSTGSEPNLKLVPTVPQSPNSPIQWSVEEGNSTAPTLDPFDSSVASEIPPVAAERENAGKLCEVVGNWVCGSSQGKNGQRQENPLVLCDGKLFFWAKNHMLPHKNGKMDPTTVAGKSYESDKAIVAPTQQSVPPVEKPGHGVLHPDPWRQVIDLCDDDDAAPNDSFQQAASVCVPAVTVVDEDNVIFVSYTPPNSDSQDLRRKLQMAQIEEPDQTATSNVTEQERMHGTPGALREEELGHSTSVNDSQQPTSAQQMEHVNPSNEGTRSRTDRDPHIIETALEELFEEEESKLLSTQQQPPSPQPRQWSKKSSFTGAFQPKTGQFLVVEEE
uniref:ligand-dependent nuclear receptor-interacting factor 1 n=1 Tax=Gasterosteus aculeatus aculeatus TaxID=481459 RepID=UPI001A9A2684|nr:ligand-dependent nuclear receptor-interacting factor 1 [Gasterosteus aculeatus aculeatus]